MVWGACVARGAQGLGSAKGTERRLPVPQGARGTGCALGSLWGSGRHHLAGFLPQQGRRADKGVRNRSIPLCLGLALSGLRLLSRAYCVLPVITGTVTPTTREWGFVGGNGCCWAVPGSGRAEAVLSVPAAGCWPPPRAALSSAPPHVTMGPLPPGLCHSAEGAGDTRSNCRGRLGSPQLSRQPPWPCPAPVPQAEHLQHCGFYFQSTLAR